MNPKYILGRKLIDILATFVHEMVHVWEHHFADKKSIRTYHNKEWGNKMESIGLMPSNTGLEGGKKTGQKMHHYILDGGPFEQVTKRLLAEEFKISWADRFIEVSLADPGELEELKGKGIDGEEEGNPKKPKKRTKDKYTCPECGACVWGKPDLSILCVPCQALFECVTAEAPEEEEEGEA